ncbi:hypothetical protein [Histophilus somni]|uniref:hypothetical protein n=1 Tax=Histophilus somni TaxID=731 RepID=UPI00201F92FA|nr:hypothetical protein [Histophilus somni]
MSILTTTGRAAIATAFKNETLHIAWGTGDPSWDTENIREAREATGLTNEIGRRKITVVEYCEPSETGDIIMRGAIFRKSTTPTPHIHLRADFDFDDGVGETIRELGVFIGTVALSTVPKGKRYLKPNELQNRGILLALDHITKIERGVASRISFDFVITF